MLFALLVTQAGIQISTAQFPSVCMKSDSLRAKECCPDFNGSKCGSDDGRGVCGNIIIPRGKSPSVRNAWLYYFDHVCICNHNFSGCDCGRCKYGHYGMNCNSSNVVERRPISEYNQKQWEDYVKILALTKKYQSNYSVFLTEPSQPPSIYPQTSPVTLYDLFVWLHHYPAKDNDNSNDSK